MPGAASLGPAISLVPSCVHTGCLFHARCPILGWYGKSASLGLRLLDTFKIGGAIVVSGHAVVFFFFLSMRKATPPCMEIPHVGVLASSRLCDARRGEGARWKS